MDIVGRAMPSRNSKGVSWLRGLLLVSSSGLIQSGRMARATPWTAWLQTVVPSIQRKENVHDPAVTFTLVAPLPSRAHRRGDSTN
jgi:hypothetical protein